MKATITQVFEACLKEVGQNPLRRGRAYRCPFCEKFKLGLDDEKGSWNCFTCSGPQKSGGIFALPIAFGFAYDKSGAARWLSEHGLIPPPEKPGKRENAKPMPGRAFVNADDLPNPVHAVWREAKRDLEQVAGADIAARIHDLCSRQRFEKNMREKDVAKCMRELTMDWRQNGGKGAYALLYAVYGDGLNLPTPNEMYLKEAA